MRARERWQVDLARYYAYLDSSPSLLQRLKTLLLTEALWAIGLYRFGQYLQEEASKPVQWVLLLPYKCTAKLLEIITGIHLFPVTQIGPGLYIGHYGGIWVAPSATLGAHCNLSQGVVIGVAGRNTRGAPKLGDCVWVGPNAVISGPVRVGSGAVVAANSLVVANVPENAVMIGVPAKVISYSGSAHLLRETAPPRPPPES